MLEKSASGYLNSQQETTLSSIKEDNRFSKKYKDIYIVEHINSYI